MLSQQEVADRAGTSLFTIQRIERGEGNVRPKTGRGVATALAVPIEELLPLAQSPLPDVFSDWERDPEPISEGERARMDEESRKALKRHGAGEKPRAYFVEGVVGAAADGWLQEVGNPDTPSDTAWGIVHAAKALENALSILLGAQEPRSLPGEALGEIARTMKLLEEVEACYGVRLEAELQRAEAPPDQLAELRRRKEQLNERKAGRTA